MTTTLSWDDLGARYFESGVDRGVLYLDNNVGVPWSGLISVIETFTANGRTPLYFDGVKYAETAIVSEFAGTIRAYTYPDEFLEYEGVIEVGEGLHVANQLMKRFSLSYRTRIGNDEDGYDHGYKIHILYNLTAVPSAKSFQSIKTNITPVEFEWSVSGIPSQVPGYRPTCHLIIDSRQISPTLLADVENNLYGDGSSIPKLPSAANLVGFIGTWVIIRILDNLDGTWTAISTDDANIVQDLVDPTVYQIFGANISQINADTYTISDTTF